MNRPVIALLGRKDTPTDAVEEYCKYLADALQPHGVQMEIRRVPWEIHGWKESLHVLEMMATQWKDNWVFLQYTALAWSPRGFPQKVIRVIKILKTAGARVAVVFHDLEPYPGSRIIDSLRRFVQVQTMRKAVALADAAVFTVPPEKLSWTPGIEMARSAFIPVGPNLPISTEDSPVLRDSPVLTIGVFSITGGDPGTSETNAIVDAVRHAAEKIGNLRLSVFGRHAEVREGTLRDGLRAVPVEVSVEGVVDPRQVVKRLSECDVLLFVRGNISSRRSSAIAGIACGLPVIAFSGSETAPPITEAGVVLIPPGGQQELNEALVRVLSDSVYRNELSSRSKTAFREHFAWPAVADRYARLLSEK
jgi:glycosyltransferase involved in cell wall biosynthesis